MAKPDYDTTLARIAGNVAAGMMPDYLKSPLVDRAATRASIVATSVELAHVVQLRLSNPLRHTPWSPRQGYAVKLEGISN